MNNAAPDLETTRGRVFFWIGLVILPVFWIWWMTPRYFNKGQRILGWIWAGVFVCALATLREPVGHFLPELALGYPAIAIRLNLALFIWFLARWLGLEMLIAVSIVSVDIVAILASIIVPTWNLMVHQMPLLESPMIAPVLMLAPTFVLAAMHLMLNPVRLWWQNFKVQRSEVG